jgi:protein O-GlcNAc transferase
MPPPTIQDALELALQHHQAGRLGEAETLYRQILAQQPDNVDALHCLGLIAAAMGRYDRAVELIRQSIAIRPDFPEAIYNLGNTLKDMGQRDDAIAAYRQAISLRPDYVDALNNLGSLLRDASQPDEAIAALQQVLLLDPSHPRVHTNLGNVFKDTGQLDDAIAEFRQAMALFPNRPLPHSNLVLSLHYHPDYDARMIHEELRRWNQLHAEPLKKFIRPHANNRDPNRRLRIGYVSPDFREHAVTRFLLPLVANHDPKSVEIFAYAQLSVADAMTESVRAHTSGWRGLVNLSDAQAVDLIRQDEIDILVDLSLHTAHNRLLVFAHKPAPVQATYLAYAGSSGLSAMDYRLSDPYLDPPGGDESVYTERTIRLPETYWCYQPTVDLPLRPPPAFENGFINFGCLNNFSKMNAPLMKLWARLLKAVPNSRLLLHSYPGSHRQRVMEQFRQDDIAPDRLNFAGKVPAIAYFESYQSIDIALDTFPYNGGTTTCDALWMGVPVISLAGRTAVGRAGLSILSNVGLPELVASTPEEYVKRAASLAGDLPRLKELRSTLRHRMETSPLMNAPRFARNVEAAYRHMWRTYCAAAIAKT